MFFDLQKKTVYISKNIYVHIKQFLFYIFFIRPYIKMILFLFGICIYFKYPIKKCTQFKIKIKLSNDYNNNYIIFNPC